MYAPTSIGQARWQGNPGKVIAFLKINLSFPIPRSVVTTSVVTASDYIFWLYYDNFTYNNTTNLKYLF